MNKLSYFNIKFLNRKESETENIIKNVFNQFHFVPLQVVPMLHHFGVHFRDNLYK